MGYTTEFQGILTFKKEPSVNELAKLQTFFGEDCRDHPEWDCGGSYIDLRFSDGFTGIEWDDETEKNNGMADHVNLIIREMVKEFPDFALDGQMIAQGEDMSDRWVLIVANNVAYRKEVSMNKTVCPHCGETIITEA